MSDGKSDLEKLIEFYGKGFSVIYDSNNGKYNSEIEPIPDADTSITEVMEFEEGFEIEYNDNYYFVNFDTLKVYENYILIRRSSGIYNFVLGCEERPQTWAELIEITYDSPYEFKIKNVTFNGEEEELITFSTVVTILWKENQEYEPDSDVWDGCRVHPEDEVHWGTEYSWWSD